MKNAVAIIAFTLCLLLVLFATPAMQAAQTALSLWWNTLLPTLFPFFACATLMERTGALHILANAFYPLSRRLRISHYALPVLLLGGMTGYPSGARLCGMLQQADCLSEQETERLATVCNLCSPMFLVGAVASGMFSDLRLFLPLAAGHYAGALLIAVALHLLFPVRPTKPCAPRKAEGAPLHLALPQTIANGMGDMLKVGGTVVFFLVLAELLTQVGVFRLLSAPIDRLLHASSGSVSPGLGILLGLLEMTGGCHLVAQAGLPLRSAATICSFLISFGGLSVFVQAMAFVQFRKPWRYLGIKLAHGGLAALIAHRMVSRTWGALEVFSPASSPYVVNALTGGTILFACALGVVSAMLLALLLGRRRKPIS